LTTFVATITRPRPGVTYPPVEVIPDTEPRYTGVLDWITTTDHKKIGVLYLATTVIFFLLGGIMALLVRLQLATPDGTFLDAERYNQVFTMHGTTMVFLFIIPVFTGFANYIMPLQIGARDMAFPRLNALSYWVFLAGGVMLYLSLLFEMPAAGWTSYVPLTTAQFAGIGQTFWIVALQIVGLSSILGALNIIVTIFTLRAPGQTFSRITLFCWALLVTAFLTVLAVPFITVAITLLLFDRVFATEFFSVAAGSDPKLYQFLFWYYSHPAVYIMILPGFGIISEVLPVFSRKPIFGYKLIAYSSVAIGFLGFSVFGHHMFAAGIGLPLQVFFMASSMLIAVPTGVKIFNWLATLWGGSLSFRPPLLFALGFLSMFVIGGLDGIFLASVPADLELTDTYWVVSHIHYVLFGGSVFAVMAGMYYWFPKMTGRLLSDRLGVLHFVLMFAGFNMTFWPMHQLGIAGMPRRVYHFPQAPEWGDLNFLATLGAFTIAASIAVFLVNVLYSLGAGRRSGADPWDGDTLEWATTSPPPPQNFDVIPVVRSARPLKEGGITAGHG
jgi:cytochrome c oxidase subunit 1